MAISLAHERNDQSYKLPALYIRFKAYENPGFCPEGVGANLFAKMAVHSQLIYRPPHSLREQVRSYALRPEADSCMAISLAHERNNQSCKLQARALAHPGSPLAANSLKLAAAFQLKMTLRILGQYRAWHALQGDVHAVREVFEALRQVGQAGTGG